MPPAHLCAAESGVHQGFEYSRSHNPTRFAWERCIADLEGGSKGYAFASGLAATSTVLDMLDSGSHVICMDDVCGGTHRLFERVRRRSAGLQFDFVDLQRFRGAGGGRSSRNQADLGGNARPIRCSRSSTSAVWEVARSRRIILVVDNTFCSPMVQRPLEHGAHGHAFGHQVSERSFRHGRRRRVVGDEPALAEQMTFLQNSVGGIQGPSTASWRCAASRPCTCAWSAPVPMPWPLPSICRVIRASTRSSILVCKAIRNTRWRHARSWLRRHRQCLRQGRSRRGHAHDGTLRVVCIGRIPGRRRAWPTIRPS